MGAQDIFFILVGVISIGSVIAYVVYSTVAFGRDKKETPSKIFATWVPRYRDAETAI